MFPASILAVSVPEKMPVKLMVNVTVILPLERLCPVTVAGMPLRWRSPSCTEVGSTGKLKFTSKVRVPGPVNVPPTGGLVEVTASCTGAEQNEHRNSKFGIVADARVNERAGRRMLLL